MRYITGTIKELVGKLTLNDHVLTHLEIMTLSRLLDGKAFTKVGTVRTASEVGRPTVIWKVDTEVALWLEPYSPVQVDVADDTKVAVA